MTERHDNRKKILVFYLEAEPSQMPNFWRTDSGRLASWDSLHHMDTFRGVEILVVPSRSPLGLRHHPVRLS